MYQFLSQTFFIQVLVLSHLFSSFLGLLLMGRLSLESSWDLLCRDPLSLCLPVSHCSDLSLYHCLTKVHPYHTNLTPHTSYVSFVLSPFFHGIYYHMHLRSYILTYVFLCPWCTCIYRIHIGLEAIALHFSASMSFSLGPVPFRTSAPCTAVLVESVIATLKKVKAQGSQILGQPGLPKETLS